MASLRRTLRWSWRDLRSRWVQVVAIALIIGLGVGAYAGLTSTAQWRKESADFNYRLLNMYDVRVELSEGSMVPQGSLQAAVEAADPAAGAEVEERLLVPTQVAVDTDQQEVLVRGMVVGVPTADSAGPSINGIYVHEGRALAPSDAGEPTLLVERNFATHYDLPTSGVLRTSGGREFAYVGHATTPEFFYVVTEDGGFFAQSTFAALFTSRETANAIANTTGMVNDAVVTLAADADRAQFILDLEKSLAGALPEVGANLSVAEDDPVWILTYEDIENDQQFFVILAVLILGGAAAAAFNLTARMVEQSRREIGISMALGVPRSRIALRPLLVGLQIALVGVLFGLLVGGLIAAGMATVLGALIPYPEWITPLQLGTFATAAIIGIAIPILAAAVPVWRAVRVAPVDAIRTGHLASRGGGLAPLLTKLRLPGNTLTKMPYRNLMRAPRRGILTALGIAATLAVLVLIIGAINSFLTAVDQGADASAANVPDRVIVTLDGTYPIEAMPVAAVLDSPTLGETDPVLQVGGELIGQAASFEVLVEFVDFETGLFRPTVVAGVAPVGPGSGLVLSAKAAADLDAAVGDEVTLRHPVRTGPTSFALKDSTVILEGIHDNPFRPISYMAAANAALMGLDGLANSVSATPAESNDITSIRENLFRTPEVASVQRADAQADLMRELIDQFIGVFRLMQGVVLILVVVIAFNASSIALDERLRDNATMFAFGVPRSRVVRMVMTENFVVGAIATILGIGLGVLILQWFITTLAPQSMPELQLPLVLGWDVVAWSVAVGVVAVTLAPLLTAPRKLKKMSIPDTLRVME
jgi:putative ABC transport system permease protein